MNVNVEKMIEFKLTLDDWFILWCLHIDDKSLLINYVKNVAKIKTSKFEDLIKDGWITTSSNDNIYTVDNIYLTDRFSTEVLGIPSTNNITFDEAFEQLRAQYPREAGKSGRRLQGDVQRCKNLYKKIIFNTNKIDEDLHKLILECIKYEIKHRTRVRSLEYFKMLATWLNQREWELYVEETKKLIQANGSITNTESGFTEDI